MKERPILFNTEMVQAILDGRKTQTRRIVNKLAKFGRISEFTSSDYDWSFKKRDGSWDDIQHAELLKSCPYGQIGDRLWVRESFRYHDDLTLYRATDDYGKNWKPSIHMPRNASRINLEITDIRIERLNDVSEDDAEAEGFTRAYLREMARSCGMGWHFGPKFEFKDHWARTTGLDPWRQDPWVWVIEFKRI